MFNFSKKKESQGTQVSFKVDGMHCSSCSMNIDGELEDTKGVLKSSTSYAKAKTIIEYDPAIVNSKQLKKKIESLDYSASEIELETP
ncbi:MAG: heavy-metal-associated domain-containing protein [Patescibacteria group bacterium]